MIIFLGLTKDKLVCCQIFFLNPLMLTISVSNLEEKDWYFVKMSVAITIGDLRSCHFPKKKL